MRAALLGSSVGLAAAAAIAAAASCSIDHRTGEFTCENMADCTGGRVCEDGYCVLPGTTPDAPRVDARPGTIDATSCPSACTSCDVAQQLCVIDCALPGANCVGTAVVCPTGWNCDIRCNVQNSCRANVNCVNARSCVLTCSGDSACRGVQCGPGPCDVSCTGVNSCRNVFCNNSCACDVRCPGPSSCLDTVSCTSFQCDTGLGCSSLPFNCNTCTN